MVFFNPTGLFRQSVVGLLTLATLASAKIDSATAIEVESSFEIIDSKLTEATQCDLRVDTVDAETGAPLPVRVVVKNAAGKYLDGAGRGVYSDGRFFADGGFTVTTAAGLTDIEIAHGPHYVPLSFSLDLKSGQAIHVRAKLTRWFSPQAIGWFGGDNHVHAQHDANADVKTDLAYTALQARAGGLNFVTEAGSNVSYENIDQLDCDDFLLRYAGEIRPGPYVGHLNTPGISESIPDELYEQLVRQPLPAQAIFAAVRQRSGVAIHTHPMTPRHQLHWMGAAEAYSDAVLGNPADLFDVDSNHTQQLWFAMLNLGNRIGVSSYTDSALGRRNTLSPGDRRVYCRADRLDYRVIVESMRAGRTMATNGGPVFVFLSVAGHQPGDTVPATSEKMEATLDVHSLNTLRAVELYQNGVRVAAFNVKDKKGHLNLHHDLDSAIPKPAWLVARAEDVQGKWCLTSPIYFQPSRDLDVGTEIRSSATLLEISNATRFVELRPDYFAHIVATVGENDRLASVELKRNGERCRVFLPADGTHVADDLLPVTGMGGEYSPGWIWHPDDKQAQHFQADWPIVLSGWYCVEMTTTAGRIITSDQMLYEAGQTASQSISIANLTGPETLFSLWGYGEDVPMADVQPPFKKGEWWYPKNGYWRVATRFGESETVLGWPTQQPVVRFRSHSE